MSFGSVVRRSTCLSLWYDRQCQPDVTPILGGHFREFNSAMIAGISAIIEPHGPEANEMRGILRTFLEDHPQSDVNTRVSSFAADIDRRSSLACSAEHRRHDQERAKHRTVSLFPSLLHLRASVLTSLSLLSCDPNRSKPSSIAAHNSYPNLPPATPPLLPLTTSPIRSTRNPTTPTLSLASLKALPLHPPTPTPLPPPSSPPPSANNTSPTRTPRAPVNTPSLRQSLTSRNPTRNSIDRRTRERTRFDSRATSPLQASTA
jgi:hypothetical protein